jgi:nucleotide-binding universal stress UspA family protein
MVVGEQNTDGFGHGENYSVFLQRRIRDNAYSDYALSRWEKQAVSGTLEEIKLPEVDMVQTILLATDGSACAGRAANFAASLARCNSMHIIVVHAYLPASSKWLESLKSHPDFETKEQAEQLVNQVVQRLKDLGIGEITAEIWEGPAASVILGAADTYHPYLLVLGARGQGLWPGACLGSVSMAVSQRADCPVLIIR